jgi:CheY-like chemotaxis protein
MHTILVADDSVTIQKAVEIVFDKEPFQVVKAGSGAEALSRAREVMPALVLVDHLMPDKNGYEVAEALKADAATANIPVLILSGNTAPYDEARARAAGVVGHLPKPFDCQTLLERVRTLLGVEATIHGTFAGGSPQPATPSAAVAGMPRPPGLAGLGRPPGLGGPPARPGVPAGVSGVPAAAAASSSPPTAAKQDPFGFGASLGASSTTPVSSSSGAGSVATTPPRPSTPASSFGASPFGASAVPQSSPIGGLGGAPISSPPMATPASITSGSSASSGAPVSASSASASPASSASPSSPSSPASPSGSSKYAEADFMEADIDMGDLASSSSSAPSSSASGASSASSASSAASASSSASSSSSAPAATNVNPFGGNGAANNAAGRSTSKVDLQRLASLDAEASQAGSAIEKATELVADRAGSAITAATGAAPSREALGEEARQIVERIAWEVVPELAEVIIREEIQRLLKSRS